MVTLIQDHLPAIRAQCQAHGVARLEVFGSAATQAFDSAKSDVDFFVEFKPEAQVSVFDHYFELLEFLTATLGRKVDLVFAKTAKNPYFLREANRSRETLYAA